MNDTNIAMRITVLIGAGFVLLDFKEAEWEERLC